jgi:hypothetical protein
LFCSERLPWLVGANHYIALRRLDGSVTDPIGVTRGATDRHAVLQQAPSIDIQTGGGEERTHFAFGVGQTWAQMARVMSVKPRADLVEMTCVAESPAVHTADQT